MSKKHVYYVDIPTDKDGVWKNTNTFFSRDEAIAFARAKYGADKNGCICLITQGYVVETEEEETQP